MADGLIDRRVEMANPTEEKGGASLVQRSDEDMSRPPCDIGVAFFEVFRRSKAQDGTLDGGDSRPKADTANR